MKNIYWIVLLLDVLFSNVAQAFSINDFNQKLLACGNNMQCINEIAKNFSAQMNPNSVLSATDAPSCDSKIYANSSLHCIPLNLKVIYSYDARSYNFTLMDCEYPPCKNVKYLSTRISLAYDYTTKGKVVYDDDMGQFVLSQIHQPLAKDIKIRDAHYFEQILNDDGTYEVRGDFHPSKADISSTFPTTSYLSIQNDRVNGYFELYFEPLNPRRGNMEIRAYGINPDMDVFKVSVPKAEIMQLIQGDDAWKYHVSFHNKIDDYTGSTEDMNFTVVAIKKPLDPGWLSVKPSEGFDSAGPYKSGNFIPKSKIYTLKNRGKVSLQFEVKNDSDWLGISVRKGELAPGSSIDVVISINDKAKHLEERLHKTTLEILNITNGKGSTSRKISLDIGEEQTWYVKMTGQETDDMGGKVMRLKMQDIWKSITVDYGVRFNYKMGAVFTIKKQKGHWVYKKGRIIEAGLSCVPVFDPTIFFVKKYILKDEKVVKRLKGRSINGAMTGRKVTLYWPEVQPAVIVYNKLKLKTNSKNKIHKGYSANYFISDRFLENAHMHKLQLKEGHLSPIILLDDSCGNRYRLDKRKPVYLYYQYFLKRTD